MNCLSEVIQFLALLRSFVRDRGGKLCPSTYFPIIPILVFLENERKWIASGGLIFGSYVTADLGTVNRKVPKERNVEMSISVGLQFFVEKGWG